MKALRISFPFSSRIGIFCKFGSLELRRPVAVTVWLKEVCTLPVYRPVIGFDKQEIVEISRKIDTFETSIQPFEDCCTIFVAKHPVTKPNLNVIHRSETKLEEKIDQLMEEALSTVEVIEIN